MLAIFNLGIPELIILAVLGMMMLGGIVAVVLVIYFSTRGQGRKDAKDD